MDVQRYISSGIIDSYVVGLLPSHEASEVEAMMMQFPEVRAMVETLRLDMEQYVQLQAVTPPPRIRELIMATISAEGNVSLNGHSHESETGGHQTPVIPISSASSLHDVHANGNGNGAIIYRVDPKWRITAVAAIVLLMGSLGMNYVYFTNYSDVKGKYNDLLLAQATMAKENQTFHTKLQQSEDELVLMRNPAFQSIKMLGVKVVKGHEADVATIYWDPNAETVYLLPQHMPELPADKQYQLWGIVGKTPVSLGVFNASDIAKGMQKMKQIKGAAVFAVTIEKQGGVESPTMDQMVVAGKVNG